MQVVNINQRYLDANIIERGKINIVKSLCNTGKTTAVDSFLQTLDVETKLLVPTFRRSLCNFLCTVFKDVANYITCKEQRIDCRSYPRICISPESFCRYRDENGDIVKPDVIIWDEFCSFLEHIVNPVTITGYQRSYFINIMSLFFQCEDITIIICDAYFDEDLDLQIIDAMAGGSGRIKLIKNQYFDRKIKLYNWQALGATEWKKRYFEEANNLDNKTFLFSNCKGLLQGLDREYIEMKIKSGTHNALPDSYVDDSEIVTADMANEKKEEYSMYPNLTWSHRRFGISPTIQAGVSNTTLHFNRGFGFAIQGSGSVLAFCQQMQRVRNLKDMELHIYFPPDIQHPKDFEEDLRVENIWADIEKYEKFVNFRVAELLEVEMIKEKDRVTVRPVVKSVLNNILVRYLYNKVREKISFFKSFQRYTEFDWYDIHCVTEFPQYTDARLLYMRNIMNTFEAAKAFKATYWENWQGFGWNGAWPGEEVLAAHKGNFFNKWLDFCDEWNVFGPLGNIRDLDNPHLRVERLAIFSKYCEPLHQSRFYSLICQPNHELIDSDSMENKYNSFQFSAQVFSVIACVFGCYGIFSFNVEKIEHIGIDSFFNNNNYNMTAEDLPIYFVARETRLNNPDIFTVLCQELERSYGLIIREFNLKFPAQTIPIWITQRLCCTKAITFLRKLLDGCLKYLGLERDKKMRSELRDPSVHTDNIKLFNRNEPDKKKHLNHRLRLKIYNIKNVHERIVLCLLKLMKKDHRFPVHPNGFLPDPFDLINFDKCPKAIPEFSEPKNRVYFEGREEFIVATHSHLKLSKIWPLKTFNAQYYDDARKWGDSKSHGLTMTWHGNVLDRFCYWNPIYGLTKMAEDLPTFFTCRENILREFADKLPLRKWHDYPFK